MTTSLDVEILNDVLGGARLLSRTELKCLISEVLTSRHLLQEPDWSESDTGQLELWKNPLIPMRDRLLIADGGYHYMRMSHQKVCRRLQQSVDAPAPASPSWTAVETGVPIAGVRYWLSTTNIGVVVGSLGSRERCRHGYWLTESGVQLAYLEVTHFMEFTKPTAPIMEKHSPTPVTVQRAGRQ